MQKYKVNQLITDRTRTIVKVVKKSARYYYCKEIKRGDGTPAHPDVVKLSSSIVDKFSTLYTATNLAEAIQQAIMELKL